MYNFEEQDYSCDLIDSDVYGTPATVNKTMLRKMEPRINIDSGVSSQKVIKAKHHLMLNQQMAVQSRGASRGTL